MVRVQLYMVTFVCSVTVFTELNSILTETMVHVYSTVTASSLWLAASEVATGRGLVASLASATGAASPDSLLLLDTEVQSRHIISYYLLAILSMSCPN